MMGFGLDRRSIASLKTINQCAGFDRVFADDESIAIVSCDKFIDACDGRAILVGDAPIEQRRIDLFIVRAGMCPTTRRNPFSTRSHCVSWCALMTTSMSQAISRKVDSGMRATGSRRANTVSTSRTSMIPRYELTGDRRTGRSL